MPTILESLTEWYFSFTSMPVASSFLARFSLVFVLIIACGLASMLGRKILLSGVHSISRKTKTHWDDALAEAHVFRTISYIAPAVVVYLSMDIILSDLPGVKDLVRRVTVSYMVFIVALVLDKLLDAAHTIYLSYDISKERPIIAYLQVLKILIFIVAAILIIGTLLNRSPWVLLSGLGALTAVLMLVFRDSILGFVASIQLAGYDMIRPGDWIEMPKFGADGDVLEVTLNTVKVQNWDKTITTIPTYALISDSFKNWRGMSNSGGRRIKRSLSIDLNSISFADEELLARLGKVELFSQVLKEKTQEISQYNKENKVSPDSLANGRRLTNIGLFRKYMEVYVRSNPNIHKDMTFLVRQLPATPTGLPLEIYAFCSDQRWSFYEDIQADIFDHLLAVIGEFDLRLFQNPSGLDFRYFKQQL